MIIQSKEGYQIGIQQDDVDWRLDYRESRPSFWLGHHLFFQFGYGSIDDFSEALGIVSPWRVRRKQLFAEMERKVELPFTENMQLITRHRIANRHLLIRYDIVPGEGLPIHQGVTFPPLILDRGFEFCRFLDRSMHSSPWEPLKPSTWKGESCPLYIALQHTNGWVLEMGLGYDLWRWEKGMFSNHQKGELTLTVERGNQQWIVTYGWSSCLNEPLFPLMREYRFLQYLGWYPVFSSSAPRNKGDSLIIRGNLQKWDSKMVRATHVHVVLPELDWPSSLCHQPTNLRKLPCLCSNAVLTRLKGLVRRLKYILPPDGSLSFSGGIPSLCTCGRHVDKNCDTLHWDWPAYLEFGPWVRHTLGDQISIEFERLPSLPLLEYLPCSTDHHVLQQVDG